MIYMMGLHFDVVATLPRSKIPFYTIRNKNADNYARDCRVPLLYISFKLIEIRQINVQQNFFKKINSTKLIRKK